MAEIVFDFKDIHKRMLGDLKAQPKQAAPGALSLNDPCPSCGAKALFNVYNADSNAIALFQCMSCGNKYTNI